MDTNSKVSIIPTEFKETCVGKTFSASKIRVEYHLLLNYRVKLCIEVVNSRFSRKKIINMNGEPVSTFSKMSVDNLRWNWSYLIDGESIEFNVEPNSSGSGVDLKIDGRDFFEYVRGVVDADASDGIRETGLSKLNTSIVFKVPPNLFANNIFSKSTVNSKGPLPPMPSLEPRVSQQTQISRRVGPLEQPEDSIQQASTHIVVKESNNPSRSTKLPSGTKYTTLEEDPLIDL